MGERLDIPIWCTLILCFANSEVSFFMVKYYTYVAIETASMPSIRTNTDMVWYIAVSTYNTTAKLVHA